MSAVFHTLHLRESHSKEKTLAQRQHARQRQKTYLKELLVQNFLKKYSQRLEASANTAAMQMLISQITAQEIEKFLERQQLSQKNLAQFEKDLQKIMESDPRLASAIKSGASDAARGGVSVSQQNLSLPKIQSTTPSREEKTLQKNRLNALIKNQNASLAHEARSST